jgi:hypothetical protein
VESIRPDLIIPTGKRKEHSPSPASINLCLAEHDKAQVSPDAIEAAHAGFAALHSTDIPAPRPARITRPGPDHPARPGVAGRAG